MTGDGWIALLSVVVAIAMLAFTSFGAELVLMATLAFLLVLGVLSPADALAGFSNEGLATVAVLFIVTAGLRETGVVSFLGARFFTQPKYMATAQGKLMLPVAILSAFINNTPVVALLIPAVRDWARRFNLPVGQLLMPLSYAAIIGGSCTLIGTSTNLIVNGMLIAHSGQGMGLFDMAIVGIPCLIVVVVFVIVAAPLILPKDKNSVMKLDDVRRYITEMLVSPHSSIVGKTIEEAGLRHLPGLFLIEIERGGVTIPAVTPGEKLLAEDRLMFAGILESVTDLQRFDGLSPAEDHVFKLNTERSSHLLMEAVVSEACPIVGKTIREGGFRQLYNAAVIAVSRNGEHVHAKPGDIVLQSGDMLLLEAHSDFSGHHRNSKDFLLISQVEDSQPYRTEKRWIALLIFAAMIGLVISDVLSLFVAALTTAGFLILTNCTSAGNARREIDWQILIVMGASMGLGNALMSTGAAEVLAQNFLWNIGDHPLVIVTGIFLMTSFLTAIITNVAAATLMFPIVLSVSDATGLALMPLMICLMIAASASFMTPVGYQTNLMVYGPGGYRFMDFVRMGFPLTVLVCLVTVLICNGLF